MLVRVVLCLDPLNTVSGFKKLAFLLSQNYYTKTVPDETMFPNDLNISM